MKTLGVSLGVEGKTNQILADKDRDTGDTKLHFVTENPTIKFEAASKTEVADLPIYEWPHMNVSQSNKWVLDCVFDWDGKFDDEAQHVLKKLSNDFQGGTEWSDQWDGSYTDHVKGLIAKQMQAGTYSNLPSPLGPSSSWDVAYTMQLAISPAGAKWHVIKHIMFQDKQKVAKVQRDLARGSVYCHSWWPHNPHGSKKYSKRYLKNLEGFRFDMASGQRMKKKKW